MSDTFGSWHNLTNAKLSFLKGDLFREHSAYHVWSSCQLEFINVLRLPFSLPVWPRRSSWYYWLICFSMNGVLSFHASAFSQLLVASLWQLPDYFYALNSFPARGRECSTASSSGRPKILGRSSTTSSWAWARSSPSRPCSPTSCRRRSTSRRRPSRRGGGRRGRKPTDPGNLRRSTAAKKFVVSFFFQSSTFRHNFYFWSRSRLGSNFFSRFFKNFWRLRRSRIRIKNWFFRDSTLTSVCLLWTG